MLDSATLALDPTPSSTEDAPAAPADLGLETLVDQYLQWLVGDREDPPFIERLFDPHVAPGLRDLFEARVMNVMYAWSQENADMASLRRAISDVFLDCFDKAGYPDPAGRTKEEHKTRLEERGFTDARSEALTAACWEHTLRFAKEDSEAARLHRILRSHLLKVAEEWVAANPALVVPLPAE